MSTETLAFLVALASLALAGLALLALARQRARERALWDMFQEICIDLRVLRAALEQKTAVVDPGLAQGPLDRLHGLETELARRGITLADPSPEGAAADSHKATA